MRTRDSVERLYDRLDILLGGWFRGITRGILYLLDGCAASVHDENKGPSRERALGESVHGMEWVSGKISD